MKSNHKLPILRTTELVGEYFYVEKDQYGYSLGHHHSNGDHHSTRISEELALALEKEAKVNALKYPITKVKTRKLKASIKKVAKEMVTWKGLLIPKELL